MILVIHQLVYPEQSHKYNLNLIFVLASFLRKRNGNTFFVVDVVAKLLVGPIKTFQ